MSLLLVEAIDFTANRNGDIGHASVVGNNSKMNEAGRNEAEYVNTIIKYEEIEIKGSKLWLDQSRNNTTVEANDSLSTKFIEMYVVDMWKNGIFASSAI